MNKQIDVLVGCQYGSEAKGLVASWIAQENKYDWLVSVNSAQAGHTAPYVDVHGEKHYVVTRQLPSACITNHTANIYIGPGSIINPDVLVAEIIHLENLGIPIVDRLYVAKTATVIQGVDIQKENDVKLTNKIGSTAEGVGAALSRRALRKAATVLDYQGYITHKLSENGINSFCTVNDMFSSLCMSGNVFLEGSQGYGLSVFNKHYPFTTSRDTTTSAFLSYAKLPPQAVRDVYGVYRTFPIRVGGNSGYLYDEIEWKDVDKISGYKGLGEYTTVTKRLRRVGMWDGALAREAALVNGVNKPVLTFVNYFNKKVENYQNQDISFFREDHEDVYKKICDLEKSIGIDLYAISLNKDGNFLLW